MTIYLRLKATQVFNQVGVQELSSLKMPAENSIRSVKINIYPWAFIIVLGSGRNEGSIYHVVNDFLLPVLFELRKFRVVKSTLVWLRPFKYSLKQGHIEIERGAANV